MPEVRNCRRCGKMYNYMGGIPICQACKELDEQDFKRVKAYLYDNPGATISQVSAVLEVSVERIKSYLKEGRLEIINNENNLVLECENCGRPITTGRLCQECQRDLASEFKTTSKAMSDTLPSPEQKAAEEARKKAIGMRYLNKDHKK